MKVNSKSMLTPALACALVAGAVAAGAQSAAAQAPAPAQVARPLNAAGANLLTNPGHEHPGAYFGGRGEINVTWNWTGYWEESPEGVDPRDQYYRTPEFRPPFARDYPERVKSGGGSDRWFNYYALNKKAGIMQYVADLPIGAPIRFTSHLQVWSTNDDFPTEVKKDVNEGNLQVRVCIDQDGGPRDMTDPNLVCSDWAQPNNQWVQLSVDGVAKNSVANAIIWSTADIPVQHNDIYADESCFEILPAPGAAGVCKGAGFIPTGPGVAPLPADVGSIQVTADQQAQTATGAPATARITAPAGNAPALAVNARTSLNLRETPANNAKIAGNAKRGAVLPVLAKSADGRWYQVELNGKQGWVLGSLTLPNAAARAVAVAQNTQAASATAPQAPAGDAPALAVNARVSLNLRETPANNGRVAGNARRGAVLPVLAKSADGRWYQVELNGKQGWVLGSLTLPNDAAKAVAVAP